MKQNQVIHFHKKMTISYNTGLILSKKLSSYYLLFVQYGENKPIKIFIIILKQTYKLLIITVFKSKSALRRIYKSKTKYACNP